MSQVAEEKISRTLYINRRVIAGIISDAVRDTEGAAGVAQASPTLSELLCRKRSERISIGMVDDVLTADVGIILESGAKAKLTAEKVQSKIKDAVQETLGMTMARVNVEICGCKT